MGTLSSLFNAGNTFYSPPLFGEAAASARPGPARDGAGLLTLGGLFVISNFAFAGIAQW